MARLRRHTEGLAEEHPSPKLSVLLFLFNAIIFFTAVCGLVGIVVFSFIHWNTFS